LRKLLNSQVAYYWKEGKRGRGSNFGTDGKKLFSHKLLIGYTDGDNKKVIIDHTSEGRFFYSVAAAKHISYGKQFADKIIDPHKQGG